MAVIVPPQSYLEVVEKGALGLSRASRPNPRPVLAALAVPQDIN